MLIATPSSRRSECAIHISKMVYTKVVSNKSPWLQYAELGKTYVNPASHGEGRFVARITLAPALSNAFILSYSQFVPGNTGINTVGLAV